MFFLLDSPHKTITPALPNAIVTIALGDEHHDTWHRVARPSWEAYAYRHGMDLIAVCTPLDQSHLAQSRSAAWQKCLVLSQPWSGGYQRIVWLDADILINTTAPSITENCGEIDKVSATLLNEQLSDAQKHILLERINKVAIPPLVVDREWRKIRNEGYTLYGIKTDLADTVATGVMALSAPHHREMLERVYRGPCIDGRAYEQPVLSYQILMRGLLHRISPRFNWGIWEENWLKRFGRWDGAGDENFAFVRTELENAYFLHFAQCLDVMKKLVVKR